MGWALKRPKGLVASWTNHEPMTAQEMPTSKWPNCCSPSYSVTRLYRRLRGRSEREREAMFCAPKLRFSCAALKPNCRNYSRRINIESRRRCDLTKPVGRFASLSVQAEYNATAASEPSVPPHYTSTLGSSSASALQLTQWNLTHRHILVLQFVACAVLLLCSF